MFKSTWCGRGRTEANPVIQNKSRQFSLMVTSIVIISRNESSTPARGSCLIFFPAGSRSVLGSGGPAAGRIRSLGLLLLLKSLHSLNHDNHVADFVRYEFVAIHALVSVVSTTHKDPMNSEIDSASTFRRSLQGVH